MDVVRDSGHAGRGLCHAESRARRDLLVARRQSSSIASRFKAARAPRFCTVAKP